MIFTNSIPIPRIATNERILSSFYSFIYLPHTKFEKKKKNENYVKFLFRNQK